MKAENGHVNQLSPSLLVRNKILARKMTISQTHFLLTKSIYLEELWGKEGRSKSNQNKTKQETVEKPLTGSAVNGMHFSIQVTHPSRTSKTGLSLSTILRGSGYWEPLGAVLNSNTLCLCGTHKHQHKLIKQKGMSFFFNLAFIFLSHTFKHLSLVQLCKSVVQYAGIF